MAMMNDASLPNWKWCSPQAAPWFACLWRRLLPSRHCEFRPSVGPNVFFRGGGGHEALQCSLQLAAPLATTLAPSLDRFPPQVAVPVGLSLPRAVLPPAQPILASLLTLPFP